MSPLPTLRICFRQRALLRAFAILACLPLSALAQADDPPKEEPVEVDAKPYAPRKLKFRDVEEPLSMPLKDLDPKLLEQRFVATVRVKGVYDPYSNDLGQFRNMARSDLIKKLADATPENLRPAKELLDQFLERGVPKPPPVALPPGTADGVSAYLIHVRYVAKTDSKLFERAQQLGVKYEREVKGTRRLLNAHDIASLRAKLNQSRFSPSVKQRALEETGFVRVTSEISFLAPTAEQAKSLAEAFLTLYDQGYALPSRKLAAKWKISAQALPAKREAELTEATKELTEAAKAFEAAQALDAVSFDAVSELRKKQLLLKIEQVGVTTRIAALEKKLADKRRLGVPLPENILSLKEEAEIDLAGLTGQLGEIERLLKVTSEKREIVRRRDLAEQEVQRLEVEREIDTLVLAVYEEDYLAAAPYELLDEAIPVQPIAWTPAK